MQKLIRGILGEPARYVAGVDRLHAGRIEARDEPLDLLAERLQRLGLCKLEEEVCDSS